MNRKEIFLVLGIGLLLLAIWFFVPEVEVSGKTTIHYETVSEYQKSWFDGMGGTISAHYFPTAEIARKTQWASWAELAERYTLFGLEISEQPGPNFLMIDLPYAAMFLKDDQGRTYHMLNQELSETSHDQKLQIALTNFDWSCMNSAFPGEPLSPEVVHCPGILVFEPLMDDVRSITLHIKYNMSGQKARSIDFEFERK